MLDVYVLGNALADITYQVPFSFLEENNIKKGLMHLINKEQQFDLLEKLKSLPHKTLGGGSAANTAVAVVQFGGSAFLSCKVANDAEGKLYLEDMTKLGVEVSSLKDDTSLPTGKCIVLVTPDADRTMTTYLGITENFSTEQLIKDKLCDAQYLYIEGYLLTSKTAREAVFLAHKWAKENNIKVALSFSDPFLVNVVKEDLQKLIASGIDLLFCNEQEAISFTETDSYEGAVSALKGKVGGFALTLGDKGAVAFDGRNEYFITSRMVNAIDVNGAGDLFAGAFLYGITHDLPFNRAGRLACDASSLLVTQYGARILTGQAQYILSKFQSGGG